MEKNTNTALAGLLAVQQNLKVPKDKMNKFGGYSYRSAEDILEKARPLCNENGLILTTSCELKLVGDRYYANVTATVLDVATGDSYSACGQAREAVQRKGMDDSQLTGAAESYAKKRALGNLFAIDDTKDADSEEFTAQTSQNGAGQAQNQKPTTNTTPQPKAAQSNNLRAKALKGLNEIIKTCGCTSDELVAIAQKHYGKSSAKDMTVGEISNLAANLEQYIKENAA